MVKKLKTIGKILITVAIMANTVMPAHAKIIFQNEFLIESDKTNTWVIDSLDDVTGDIILQFGNTIAETFMWDYTNSAFKFSNNVSFDSNQMLDARIENADGNNSLPGGATGLGVGGRGRIVQLTGTDTVAPGCTISPNCGGGTYVWDGGTWISLTGTTSSNFNKLITVGSTGSDYTTIANGAAYLQTLSGGIMLLSAETHQVTTAVNMTNIIMIGKDSSRTIVNITGSGKLDSYDTTYEYLTIQTGSIDANMAIDVQAGSNALLFNYVDINIQDSGDSLIDSTAGTAPTTTMKFIKSNMAGGNGVILKPKATGNLNTASTIYIDSRSSDTPLQMSDWDLTLAGGGSVNTSGTIYPVPADSIIVSPDMNLQGAIDSLETVGRGGLITLLPGTYNINTPLTINDDYIQIIGYGDASVINASGFTGGDTVGAIQIGSANGTSAVNNVVLKDFKLNVSGTGASDIHGIRVTGGVDNRIDNVTVIKISGASGSTATARIGIQMTDAAAGCTGTCVLTRPVIYKSRILGTSGASAYFTDGIHITSDGSIGGIWGNGQGVNNALVDGNFVDYVGETAYVFVGVDDSSLFNNRASRMGAGGAGAYGIYMGNAKNINMNANVFSGSLSATAIAIGIESFNVGTLKETTDSIFNNNIIDGTANGGLGFATGFQIGNATNTGVHRCSFYNNIVNRASIGTTTAIILRGNADDNTISNNSIDGSNAIPDGWDTGISITSATAERNRLIDNRFSNTTTLISDAGSHTQLNVNSRQANTNPTVNDDITRGYGLGTIWVNTATDSAYILTDNTTGTAVWQAVGSGTVSTTLAAVQARRTTDFTMAALNTWYDITLDSTDVETDATVLEHDNTNTDQIDVKEDGTYRITYQINANDGGATHQLDSRVRVNDTTVLNGSLLLNRNYQNEYGPTTASFLAVLSTGDYITLQSQRTTANTIINETTMTIVKLEGVAGSSGSGNGTTDETFTIDTDDTGGNLALQFGTTLAETISWNSALTRFEISDDLHVTGAISTDAVSTKYLWLELTGGVRTSATTGSVNGGTSPVIRFDAVDDSRSRWTFPVPDDWVSGTDIEIEVFWSPADGTAGNVYYELDYQSWANGETISGATTLTSTEAAPGTALQLDAFTFTIPNTALATDDMVNIRLSREPGDAADTYANDINIHLIRINYTGKKLL